MNSTDRFTGRVATYNRYRLRYPTATILDRLRLWCHLQPHWRIADIGAGTGMLTEVFLSNGNPVIAIEPNQEMRATCADLRTQYPALQLRNTTAESTGLPDHSIDLISAGRAFHWFNTPRALAEFNRILQPNGWLVLVSLGRAKIDTPQARDFESLLTNHGTDYADYVRGSYRIHENLDQVFTADRHHEQIHGQESLDWESFLGQTMSLSVTPPRDSPCFPAFHQDLRDYFTTYAIENQLTTPTTCWIDAGRISAH
ncbi:MAG: class I SAM-dependent methyltransferase [Acidobacteriaceae bacterium]